MELAAFIPHRVLRGLDDHGWAEPLDAIYVGEPLCELRDDPELAQRVAIGLRELGKKVYATTAAIPSCGSHLAKVRRYFELAERGVFDAVAVNDAGALEIGARDFPSVSLFVGPFVDVRNAECAKTLAALGARRIALPYDLPITDVRKVAESVDVEVEVMVHGPIPLMVSRRCFLARARGIGHDDPCGFICEGLAQGMPVATLDCDEPFLVLGGRAVYSAKDYCLLEHLSLLEEAGVDAIRVEERSSVRPQVYRAYRRALEGRGAGEELAGLSPHGLCNAWFFGREGYRYEQRNPSRAG